MSPTTEAARTVKFNVGGTLYEVSKSLLEQHPDTMMARMASEMWSGANDKKRKHDDEPLFVERNGNRFQYVLDYMRDGQVELPVLGVTKESLLKDMEYYGFENVNEKDISTRANGSEVAGLCVRLSVHEFQEALAAQKRKLDHESLQYASMVLAKKCFAALHIRKYRAELTQDMFDDTRKETGVHQYFVDLNYYDFIDGEEEYRVLNTHLGRYFGLKLEEGYDDRVIICELEGLLQEG